MGYDGEGQGRKPDHESDWTQRDVHSISLSVELKYLAYHALRAFRALRASRSRSPIQGKSCGRIAAVSYICLLASPAARSESRATSMRRPAFVKPFFWS